MVRTRGCTIVRLYHVRRDYRPHNHDNSKCHQAHPQRTESILGAWVIALIGGWTPASRTQRLSTGAHSAPLESTYSERGIGLSKCGRWDCHIQEKKEANIVNISMTRKYFLEMAGNEAQDFKEKALCISIQWRQTLQTKTILWHSATVKVKWEPNIPACHGNDCHV